MMVEVMPRVWVNPEQVAGLWGDGTVVKIMLNGQVCAWRNDDNVDLSVIAAKLNLPTKWEQPPGTVMYADTSGAPRTGYEPFTDVVFGYAPTDDSEQVGARGPTGARGPSGVRVPRWDDDHLRPEL